MEAFMANSTASLHKTGRAPGSPRQTGQTLVLGGAPKPVGQPQKILVRVPSCTCTSRPITGSYFAMSSGGASSMVMAGIRLQDNGWRRASTCGAPGTNISHLVYSRSNYHQT